MSVIDKCSSPMGARLLRNWLAMPVMDISELESRYDGVQYFFENVDRRCEARDLIGGIGDLERIISRAAMGRIVPREVMQLSRGLERMVPVKEICENSGVDALQKLAAGMRDCSALRDEILRQLSGKVR